MRIGVNTSPLAGKSKLSKYLTSRQLRERLLRAREAAWKSIALLKASGMNFALSTDANHGGVA